MRGKSVVTVIAYLLVSVSIDHAISDSADVDEIFADRFEPPPPRFFRDANGVTIRCPHAEIGETGEVDGTVYTRRERLGITAQNSSTTCTTGITDMSRMFSRTSSFNQPLDSWDVSSVTNMSEMFAGTLFNQPLSNWDVSSVRNMNAMFYQASFFNQPLDGWDVSAVTDMGLMFWRAASFNQRLSSWDVSSVQDMSRMFSRAPAFNQPLDSWDVSSVTTMQYMFRGSESFNQPLARWNVDAVTSMLGMFQDASAYNQDLSSWCVSKIPSKPLAFDRSASSWTKPNSRPVWGTCP